MSVKFGKCFIYTGRVGSGSKASPILTQICRDLLPASGTILQGFKSLIRFSR